jgi:hypothetical protein
LNNSFLSSPNTNKKIEKINKNQENQNKVRVNLQDQIRLSAPNI